MAKKDLFAEENTAKGGGWTQWNEIGKSYQGVYVEKKTVPNNMKKDGSKQTVYVLIQPDGTPINAVGPGGRDLIGFNGLRFGSVVGVKYVGDGEPKPGQHAAKYVNVFFAGEMNLEVLKQYHGGDLMSEENEIPSM